jgi:hypothetical protein
MRKSSMGSILALVAVLLLGSVRIARTAEQSGVTQNQTPAFDPDLSGVWTQHPPASARGYALYSFGKEVPPMTPWAEGKFKANKPSFGPRGQSKTQTTPLIRPPWVP